MNALTAITPHTAPSLEGPSKPTDERDAALRESAKAFEATFIKQMLDTAGFADAFGSGGSATTESFASFVLQEIADDMVEKGGFGLAEDIYRQLASFDDVQSKETRA
ncbi:MAG: rod-binding protein [Pseudomonadota bacterium]